MINFKWYKFNDLTVEKLYSFLSMRSNIFVVEQNCVYLDPDSEDIFAMHLLGFENDSLVAYLRYSRLLKLKTILYLVVYLLQEHHAQKDMGKN